MFGSPLEGVRVLLVDDHAAVREVITRLLGSYGARVTAVSGVAEALEALLRQPAAGPCVPRQGQRPRAPSANRPVHPDDGAIA